jgi:hypothetical protein
VKKERKKMDKNNEIAMRGVVSFMNEWTRMSLLVNRWQQSYPALLSNKDSLFD